ncbi:NADPH-dependent ferric siderophore reductase [Isoptericola sp. CG 20/1183]|uniref:NADPH-dependent ferric siderophore reductase n=1 Tax=Isoptericola halotolerans TaxID=300560 RepID=A0ABX5EG50_9MICO|nr:MULTISPECIES: siderophore-interacting protein [Isoptericola]PRZ05106.1 NADPH-dependent ferric siderophore reductase [Isoptericola halotolerans]PRZ05844.1 NADPH-dependent ferric siderophore reductase [Isoptericola sp. CG 20/1183]
MSSHHGRKPVDPQVVVAEVVTTKQVTPHMMRVTLGGLDRFTPLGFDQWFRLFLQRSGQDMLRPPTRSSEWGWYLQYLATPRSRRPWVRNYTVRAARPDLGEIDVDFVIHADAEGSSGPAADFATTARTGDTVGLLDQGATYDPQHPHDWTLLVGDETALPAVAGICESLPADARGIAVVEVPTADDQQDFRAPSGVEVRWVARDETTGADAVPGQAALAEVRRLTLPDGVGSAYAAGEAGLATGVRRHLVAAGMPKAHITFLGYWRHGKPAAG